MIKRLLIVSLLLIAGVVEANKPFSLYTDTVAWDVTDSLMFLPAYDDYCHWEQGNIWRKSEDLTQMNDSVSLGLILDSCQFHAPIIGRLTSDYGWRRNRPHYGVDIKLQKGDSVGSVFEGVVRIAKYSSSYGNVVVVRHANGLETLYAHLSKLTVQPGDVVEAAAIVGLGGNTGRSFGSHLHFEVRYLGEPFDPKTVFELSDSSFSLKSDSLQLTAVNFALAKKARAIRIHRVRSGDSLWKISRRYGVSVAKLCRINGISRKKTLRIGQRIRYN